MESVNLRTRSSGITADVECYAVAAEEKTSERTGKPYYKMVLAPSPEGAPVYTFCEKPHAELVAKALKSAGKPVKVSATLSIGGRAVNVTDVSV